jgi:hypothetical protein
MSDDGNPTGPTGLNPVLRSRTNTSRDTETPMLPPADSASVQRQEGRAWPIVWLIVVLACVIIALGLIFWKGVPSPAQRSLPGSAGR